jgi:hypothetical protein
MFGWGMLIVAIGCERSTPERRKDSAEEIAERVSPSLRSESDKGGWNNQAGPALLIQGETRDEAIVVLPFEGGSTDTARLDTLVTRGVKVSLFGRGGVRLTARLGARSHQQSAECRVFALDGVQGDNSATTWSVGFFGPAIIPLVLDSVDVLTSSDSMALAAEAARLASAVTAITGPLFQGLRFTAHDVRRFEATPGVQALVAHLVRRVNQEANPQEEQTLLIAERDSGVTSGPYKLAYAERTHGLEEQATTPEVVAGTSIAGRPTLVIARDSDEGVTYVTVERTGPRRWQVRWTSALTRCG